MEQARQITMAETKVALDILDSAFFHFSKNERFPEDLKLLIESYISVYEQIPEGILIPHIQPFAEVNIMDNSIADLVNTGLFHYVIYKNLLSDYFGAKKR